MKGDELKAFAARVLERCKPNAAGCLEWTGARGAFGHGRVRYKRQLYSPHRVVAAAAGIVPTVREPGRKRNVLHRCDNPACCNVEHLMAGTLSDNMRDCSSKGRSGNQFLSAKLSHELK